MGRKLRLNLVNNIDEITKALVTQESTLEAIAAYHQLLQIQEQLDGYHEVDDNTCQKFSTIIGFIPSQIFSSNKDIAKLALKCMRFFTRKTCFGTSIPNEMIHKILLSLVELVKSTKFDELCKLGMECIFGQLFVSCISNSELSFVLDGVIQAMNNMTISPIGGFEALTLLVAQTGDSMRELSHLWATSIYEKLLSFDMIERELADNCLQKLKSSLLPPTPSLAKIVAEDVQKSLLLRMETMIETHDYKIPVVHAWGWFISLLGIHVMENRALVNSMLKILERTFLDTDIEIRIESQLAWKAMIDILVPPATEGSVDPRMVELSPGLVAPTLVGGRREPLAQLTSKRMKLLMMPLIGTMTIEKCAKARNSCWKICTYILQKLGWSINKKSVVQLILVPMFEAVFKSGRKSWNVWAWDSCASLFEEFVSLKIKDEQHRSILLLEGPPIKWLPWKLCHLEFIVKIFGSLWNSAGDLVGSENWKSCLKSALRIWQLILKGLDMEGDNEAEFSSEHQASVHLILKFMGSICDEAALLFEATHKRELAFSVWPLLQCLMVELRPLFLTSSLYKLPLNLGKVKDTLHTPVVDQSATRLNSIGNDPPCIASVQCEEMVTPIVYATVLWMKFVSNLGLCGRENSEFLNVKNADHWLLCAWRTFAELIGTKAESWIDILIAGQCDQMDQFILCLILYPFLISSISKVKKVSDETEDAFLSNTFPSSQELEYFTGDFIKIYDPTMCSLLFKNSLDSGRCQRVIRIISGQECPARIQELHNSECALSLNTCYDFAAIFGKVVASLLKEMYASLNDNINLQPSGPNGHLEEGRVNGYSNLVDTLSLAARFLMLVWEVCSVDVTTLDAVSRVCEALMSLCSSLYSQHDILLFVQILSKPLAVCLCACSDSERHYEGKPLAPQLDKFKHSKVEISFRACKIVNHVDLIGLHSCGDGSILALASSYLILACDSQEDNLKLCADSVSRVCESLICLSNYLHAQHDTLAFMQALSKPLVKWFNASVFPEKPACRDCQTTLLEKLWHQLLACLQNCQPPILFDSSFLNHQASLLVSAFQSPHKLIVERTCLFWEATYGIKASRLSYPPCLVPVLCELQQNVKLTLPGFLHTYVSRRGRKHQTKEKGQEHCAVEKEPLCLVMAPRHGERGHANFTSMSGHSENRMDRTATDASIVCKRNVYDGKVGVRMKTGKARKYKCGGGETSLLNCISRKSMAAVHNSELVQRIVTKQIEENKHGSQRDGFNVKSSVQTGNIETPKRKRGRPPKHHPNTAGKRNFATQRNAISWLDSVQSDLGQCSNECENARDHAAFNCSFDAKRCISSQLVEKTGGTLKKIRRSRKFVQCQLKLLTSDLRTLGIRHLRTLRNAGGLRGGKDWRTANERKNKLPRMLRQQHQQFDLLESNEVDRIRETNKNKLVLDPNSSNIGTVGQVLHEDKLELQPCNRKTLPSLVCLKVEAAEEACKFLHLPASEFSFKVRALGSGNWSRTFGLTKSLQTFEGIIPFAGSTGLALESSEKSSSIRGRNNRRKSGTPKRAPTNMAVEDMIDMHLQPNLSSQVEVTSGEQKTVTGKRLKDVDIQLSSRQRRDNVKIVTPLKKLRTGKEKCFAKRLNANIQLECGADPSHATQGCEGDITYWAGIDVQSQTLGHHDKPEKQNDLGDCDQEGISFFSINRYRPKDDQKELEAGNEASCQAQSETHKDVESSELHASAGRRVGGAQLCNHTLQSTEGKQPLQRHAQPCDLNGSSGTSLEGCIAPSMTNHLVATCKYTHTNSSEIHQESKKGLALLEAMGEEWSVCDILSEISSSSKLEDLGKQDLSKAENLLVVLLQSIEEKKRLLSKII